MSTSTQPWDPRQNMYIEWQCQQFLYQVTHLIDSQQWDALSQCYTQDAILWRPSSPTQAIVGRHAILNSFLQRKPKITNHILSNLRFDVVSDKKVMVSSKVWLVSGEYTDILPTKNAVELFAGDFYDCLVMQDNNWFIQERKGSINVSFCAQNA